MVKTNISWVDGPVREDHTQKKHTILAEYFSEYLRIRCKLPQQTKFRLAIVDGFSGAGLYKGGVYGSPLIFLDVLSRVTKEINLHRISEGFNKLKIECLIILNDSDREAIEALKKNAAPLLSGISEIDEDLTVESIFINDKFENIYPDIKSKIISTKIRNVFFNLDQYGYVHVTPDVIKDIMRTWRSAEVLLTFMIQSFLAYLSPHKGNGGAALGPEVQERISQLLEHKVLSKKEWLGEAEKITYYCLKDCASFVSPFSINNPDGWQYWFMHFATSHRARQVYNDILHQFGEAQAHYGRPGLNMFSYDPRHGGAELHLFDEDSRKASKDALMEDIPRLISASNDALLVKDFYESAYSETPAHSEDINQAIIEHPELEVRTTTGGTRRKPNTIEVGDTILRVPQRRLF